MTRTVQWLMFSNDKAQSADQQKQVL